MTGARFWAAVPVVLLLSMIGGLLYLAAVASNDPSFAVEQDYYDKAARWDRTQAQAAQNSRLGWQLDLSVTPSDQTLELVTRPKDAHGKRLSDATVRVEAFPLARSAQVVLVRLEPQADGSLSTKLPLARRGIWELRFTVEAHGERYTETVRKEVPLGDGS